MSNPNKHSAGSAVGKNIRTLRHRRGWSQEDVAKKLNISIPAFSKIETGVTDVNLSRLEQIANIYEVSVVQLLALDEAPAEPQLTALNNVQQKLNAREIEIATLQRKVIELYEELHTRGSYAS
ncbi:helix-turn-helix domain-containing protein [Mucilaginibacter sp. RS28]|uniref:Helix-turn-helix domain-containing protein n=1 Tax=Mucilaginibacter straminoryzae TaxID=2932774 RepID=A0A9X2BCI1_9SPHI|nr:helix-turn-helix transcriptional regulator [Mucilaginibacter straminoryzae]MCJ8210932.1 helix-turn-helix domain-containing protein [Mucilaginibacter straminoryzae]